MALVYFLLGAGALCVVRVLRNWAKSKGGDLGWYHWVGVGIVALWTLFVAAWVGTSLGEGFPSAAAIGGLIFGGIDVIFVVLLRLWIVKSVGAKAGGKPAKAAAKAA